ncbi:MAG: cytidine deaminase [Bdellovibrionales bacterium]|nr:cytidine deaminase [Bdellovibrionales bacterium]
MPRMKAELVEKAYRLAREARGRSYAPYSKFRVGAALILADGTLVPGCNVENASYGGTCCAERTAIFSAIAQYGQGIQPKGLVLVTEPVSFPCGLCLQVMGEFFRAETPVYLADEQGIREERKFRDLLPNHFGPEFLTTK